MIFDVFGSIFYWNKKKNKGKKSEWKKIYLGGFDEAFAEFVVIDHLKVKVVNITFVHRDGLTQLSAQIAVHLSGETNKR